MFFNIFIQPHKNVFSFPDDIDKMHKGDWNIDQTAKVNI